MTESTVELPRVASREEWLAARLELLAKEKAATRARDALSAERRRLPMVRIEKEYVFAGPEGKVSLLELFAGRRQLIVHHFMWLDEQGEGCPGCSMQVDTVGDLRHLQAAETSLVFITRAPIEAAEAFRARMGWKIPLYSSAGSDFNYDFHATIDRGRGAVEHNYRDFTEISPDFEGDLPAQSVFVRDGNEVFHSYSAYARGTEPGSNFFGFLDMTPLGRREENRVRHHDRYEQEGAASCCGGARP